jgi:fused signal recognition particle receptor
MSDQNKNIFNKWKQGLARTRKTTFGRISQMLGTAEIDADTWDELEAMFLQADMGFETTEEVIEILREHVRRKG